MEEAGSMRYLARDSKRGPGLRARRLFAQAERPGWHNSCAAGHGTSRWHKCCAAPTLSRQSSRGRATVEFS
jgi:hypothetical protein